MLPRRFLISIAIVLISAVHAHAHRFGFEPSYDGKAVEGTEVCFWPGLEGSARTLYFATPMSRCLPADKVIDLPNGTWHFYARNRAGYMYVHRTYTVAEGPDDKRGYSAVGLDLEPAATLDMGAALDALRAGERIVLWVTDSSEHLGTVLPVNDDDRNLMVPADRPFVVILLRDATPVKISDSLSLAPGKATRFDGFNDRPGLVDVVGWVKVDGTAVRASKDPAALSRFHVVLVRESGDRVAPLFPIAHPRSASYALQIFEDIPAGTFFLELEGASWLRDRSPVRVARSGVSFFDQPLVATPAGAVEMSWSFEISGSAFSDDTTCHTFQDERKAAVHSALFRCSEKECSEQVAEDEQAVANSGEKVFGGLSPGQYEIWFKFGALPVTKQRISIAAGETVVTRFDASTAFAVRGTISRRGSPILAVIRFINGTAISDELGAFETLLPEDPGLNLIRIEDCATGRQYKHFVNSLGEVGLSTTIDIDARDVALRLLADDDEGLQHATSSLVVLKESGKGAHYTESNTTPQQDGTFLFAIPQKRKFHLCGEAKGYEARCADDMADDSPTVVELKLRRAKRTGFLVSGETLANATIYFVDPTGTVNEITYPDSDGSFSYQKAHDESQYSIVTSDTAPLSVAPVSAAEDGSLTVRVPVTARRDITVRTDRSNRFSDALVGLRVNGFLIPTNVLIDQQGRRGADVRVRESGRLVLKDIPVGATQVAVGPSLEVERALAHGVDVFTSPEFAPTIQWKTPNASGEAVFP
jgi:hypothetical protein